MLAMFCLVVAIQNPDHERECRRMRTRAGVGQTHISGFLYVHCQSRIPKCVTFLMFVGTRKVFISSFLPTTNDGRQS